MAKIRQNTEVHCPLFQASDRLAEVFRAHGNAEGDSAHLTLWVDASIPGMPTPIRLERSVIVTIERLHLVGEMVPTYTVRWGPTEPGPFPTFTGTLHVDADDDYDTFSLRLDGAYEPPLGLIGAAFDGIIGGRIAAMCSRNLLSLIAGEIEANYAKDEAEKSKQREELSSA
ncbi:MAG: hypothetical protein ABI431_08570 [Candidatus Tumulicola sp.]